MNVSRTMPTERAVEEFFGTQYAAFVGQIKEAGVDVRDFAKWVRDRWPPPELTWDPEAAQKLSATMDRLREVAPEYDVDPAHMSIRDVFVIEQWEVRHAFSRSEPLRRSDLKRLLQRSHLTPPRDLLKHLVDAFTGQISYPRGFKKGSGPRFPRWSDTLVRRAQLHRIWRWQRAYERQRRRTKPAGQITERPYLLALARVSRETGVPESTLDKWYYPRKT